MSNKEKYIIGGVAIAGIIVLIVISRSGTTSSNGAMMQSAPVNVPAFPSPAPLPPLNIEATPYYMTVNLPPASRNLIAPPQPVTDSCCDQCASTKAGSVPVSQDTIRRSMLSIAPHISFNPAI